MIFIWLNLGILPFWFMLLFFPETKICRIFVTSIFPLLVLAALDLYLLLEIFKNGFNFSDIFTLYLGIEQLINLFSSKEYVIIFWIHFLAINLFCASWIVKDYKNINMPKFFAFISLVLTYFIGPIGLVIYWFIRIFFSKKIALYD